MTAKYTYCKCGHTHLDALMTQFAQCNEIGCDCIWFVAEHEKEPPKIPRFERN